ncbi:hypothetical protein [Kineococcus sp. SYSU DK004]|uniref:hypothetical protein n=1 Tax=Kineococcus sp. SYSU DK004 TaxID=3383125 RepID=UPI003D7EC9F5
MTGPSWALWVLLALLLLAVAAWHLSSLARRVDRLHHRVETSRAVLDAELTRRASAALELATSGALDPATSLLLADAATTALDAPRTPAALREAAHADDVQRWRAESVLSDALDRALGEDADGGDAAGRPVPGAAEAVARVRRAGRRAQLARRFHNDAVVQTLRLRGKRVVRWGRLAGHARLPETADFDDGTGRPWTADEGGVPAPGAGAAGEPGTRGGS